MNQKIRGSNETCISFSSLLTHPSILLFPWRSQDHDQKTTPPSKIEESSATWSSSWNGEAEKRNSKFQSITCQWLECDKFSRLALLWRCLRDVMSWKELGINDHDRSPSSSSWSGKASGSIDGSVVHHHSFFSSIIISIISDVSASCIMMPMMMIIISPLFLASVAVDFYLPSRVREWSSPSWWSTASWFSSLSKNTSMNWGYINVQSWKGAARATKLPIWAHHNIINIKQLLQKRIIGI